MLALAVAVAAGLGAALRHVVDSSVQRRHGGPFPWGTLVVNVSGSLLLGLVVGLASRGLLQPGPAAVLSLGLAGGYTTLSTWAWETTALARQGARRAAVLYAVGTHAACLAAAGTGLAVTRL